MEVLVIDIGGSQVKLYVSSHPEPRKFDSGPDLTPEHLAKEVRRLTRDWPHDAVSIGYPGRVTPVAGPSDEPGNLGDGWVGFDFEKALGVPVRIVHDAVLQALGGYQGGRMLFLGFGTGLGSALIIDHVAVGLELGDILHHASGVPLWQRVGKEALERNGQDQWRRDALDAIDMLHRSLAADYILLGGGNAPRLTAPLPPYCRVGGNDDAFQGGLRLWEELVEPHDQRPSRAWRVL